MEPAIRIERDPDEDTLRRLGVFDWPIWTKEASRGLSCTWEIHKSVRKHYTFG